MQLPFVVCRSRCERVVGHAPSLAGASPRRVRNPGRETTRHKAATRTRPGTVPHGCLGSREPAESAVPSSSAAARTSLKRKARQHNRCRSHTHHVLPCTELHGPARRAHRVRNFDADDRFVCNDRALVPDHAARPPRRSVATSVRGLARRRALPCAIVSFATIARFRICPWRRTGRAGWSLWTFAPETTAAISLRRCSYDPRPLTTSLASSRSSTVKPATRRSR